MNRGWFWHGVRRPRPTTDVAWGTTRWSIDAVAGQPTEDEMFTADMARLNQMADEVIRALPRLPSW